MAATSRASPTARDAGMVTVEAAIALCAFVVVLAMTLAGMATVLDQLRCTDAAREAARLVARGERDEAADAVGRIAPSGAAFTVTDEGAGIVVDVRDPAAGGLLPGVHVTADAYAVPEPDAGDDAADTEPESGGERSTRSAGGGGR